MQAKAIPAPGSWGTKKTKPDEAAVLFRVESVDPVKEQFTVERFAGFDGATPLFGRQSTISFATWQTGRYQPCDPPAAPVPEMLDRAAAEARLRAIEPPFSAEEVADILDSPRATIEDAAPEKDIPPQARETSRAVLAICAAYVRWLDIQAAPPVPVFVPPAEPTTDLRAEVVALRGEVAGLRADFRALMKAIEAGGQLRLFPVAA
jgi:hypothetical protein